MLRIAVCDDSRTDVEMLEAAFDELPDYPVEYDVYFSRKELLMCSMQDKENYHLYIFDIEICQKETTHSELSLKNYILNFLFDVLRQEYLFALF